MFDPIMLFGFFTIIPAFKATYEITSDSSEAFEGDAALALVTTTAWAAIAFNDAGVSTDWVTVNP